MSSREIRAGKAEIEIGIRNRIAAGAKGVQADLNRLGRKVTSIGKVMGGAGLALGTGFAGALMSFAKFDDAMRATGASVSASEKDLAMLTETAKELGRTTSFTAVDVANLMTELGRAGFDPSQINEMTGAVLNLARATGTDAVLSSGILASSIRQFNLEAGDAARVSDVLTAAANMSFNSVESLGEALSYAGPVANDFKMSIEETAAVLGTLGNVGIQGSEAGTSIRRLLTITGAEAQKLQGIFGVAFKDAAGNTRPLVDTLGEVAEATNGLGTAARAEKFSEAFGLLGITAASAIGKTAASTKELLAAIRAAAGLAAKTNDEMDAGLGGSFRKITSAAGGFADAIGETLAPAVKKVIDNFTGAISGSVEWIEKNKELVSIVAGSAVALVAGGSAMIALGFSAQIAAAGIALMFSPIVVVTGAVAGLGWALMNYTTAGGEAIDWLTNRFGPLVNTVKDSVAAISAALASGDIDKAWALTTELMELSWLDMTGGIRDAWGETMDWLLDSGSSVAEGLGAIFEALASTLDGLLEGYKSVYDKMYNYHEAELTKGVNSFMGIETMGGPVEPKGSAFDRQFGEQKDALKTAIEGVREFGKNMQDEAKGQVAERMKDREAAKAERAKRITELQTSLKAKSVLPPEPPKADEKPPTSREQARSSSPSAMLPAASEGTKQGETGTFSGAAAAIIGQGQSQPQRMLSLTERIAKAVEDKAFRQPGKADREQAREVKLQAKAEENRKRFGDRELTPGAALEALFANFKPEAELTPSAALDALFADSRQNEQKAMETQMGIDDAQRQTGIGAKAETESVTNSVSIMQDKRGQQSLEMIAKNTAESVEQLKKKFVARYA